MKVTVSRKAHFNAAHRLYVEDWSEEKNNKVFGKCCNENYHGHNYELVVDVIGDVDKTTGIVIDLKVLKDIIKEEIEEVLDHKNLNLDVPYFKKVIPTAENICIFIWDIMRKKISKDKDSAFISASSKIDSIHPPARSIASEWRIADCHSSIATLSPDSYHASNSACLTGPKPFRNDKVTAFGARRDKSLPTDLAPSLPSKFKMSLAI